MSKPLTTKESEPMTDREAAVAAYDAWSDATEAEITALENQLAADIAALQQCEYVRLQQAVARGHRAVDEARLKREREAAAKEQALRSTAPAALTDLHRQLVEMADKIRGGHSPWHLGECVTTNWSQLPPDMGVTLTRLTRKAADLHADPHPEAGMTEIRAELARLKAWKPNQPTTTALPGAIHRKAKQLVTVGAN